MMSPAAAAHPYRTAMTPANVEDDRRGASFVDASGRPLVLAGATLSVTAAGGVARSVLEQRFENPYPETLRVTYKLPLPADGAVSGFDFQIGARHVTGEVDTKGQARERFERAISEGRTAALLDEERSSVFTETIGNVPPGATIVVRITVDQRLAWLDEGAWEYRFPTVIGPRYRSASTTPEEHARVAVPTVTTDTGHRMALSVDVRDRLPSGARVESPSHRLGANGDGTHGLGVWWRQWRPSVLHRTDLRPDKSPDAPDGLDATATGWPDGRWEQVALDPPYGLRGTDTGDAQLDRFGLAESMTCRRRSAWAVSSSVAWKAATREWGRSRMKPTVSERMTWPDSGRKTRRDVVSNVANN